MRCKFCKEEMQYVYSNDTGTGQNHFGDSLAINLYVCDECFAVARENVWDFADVVWIESTQKSG